VGVAAAFAAAGAAGVRAARAGGSLRRPRARKLTGRAGSVARIERPAPRPARSLRETPPAAGAVVIIGNAVSAAEARRIFAL